MKAGRRKSIRATGLGLKGMCHELNQYPTAVLLRSNAFKMVLATQHSTNMYLILTLKNNKNIGIFIFDLVSKKIYLDSLTFIGSNKIIIYDHLLTSLKTNFFSDSKLMNLYLVRARNFDPSISRRGAS